MLLNDNHALVGYPVFLVVALITTTAILAIFATSLHHINIETQTHQIEHEIQKIITQAEYMFAYADEGSQVTIRVDFPGSLRYIIFGGMPNSTNPNLHNLTAPEHTSNNYYYVLEDGTTAIFHSFVRFSGKNETSPALFHSGYHYLTLELCRIQTRSYVKIYTQ